MGHGSMSCQLKTTRLIMILINTIFFLIGATLLGQGIDLVIHPHFQSFTELITIAESSNIIKNNLLSNEILYIIMIISGLILICIGFFGCSGAITQIQFLLFCYAILIGIILIFQTIIIICLFIFRTKFKEQLIFKIRSIIRDAYKGPFEQNIQTISSLSYILDLIMFNLKCCGLENKNDFNITNKWNRTNPWWNSSISIENKIFKYPLTCCPINKDSKLFDKAISCAINGSNIYEISCYKQVINILHSIQGSILISVLFIIIIEMFALTFVLVMYNRNQMNRRHYVMERLPPPYSSRTRINNGNLYFQI